MNTQQQIADLRRSLMRSRWFNRLAGLALVTATAVHLLPGCGGGSTGPGGHHVEVSVNGSVDSDHARFKKLAIVNDEGKTVVLAEPDENGNGKLSIFNANGDLISTYPLN